MQLIRISNSQTKEFAQAYQIYKDSFPIFEQRSLKDQLEALTDPDYHCHIIQNDDQTIIGLLFTWRTNSFIYVEHLAILESERGKNLGTSLLNHLKETSSLPIILEIDPPVDAISIRRKGFYENLGFVMHDFDHIHPAFCEDSGAYSLKVLAMPPIDTALYNEFRTYLDDRIMYYSFSRK